MLIQGCGVRLIFVDEFQHVLNKDTQHILFEVADLLKDNRESNSCSYGLGRTSG